jgi:hypothetical protein
MVDDRVGKNSGQTKRKKRCAATLQHLFGYIDIVEVNYFEIILLFDLGRNNNYNPKLLFKHEIKMK